MLDSGQSEPQIKLDGLAMLLHNCQHTLSLCIYLPLFLSHALGSAGLYKSDFGTGIQSPPRQRHRANTTSERHQHESNEKWGQPGAVDSKQLM